MLFDANCNFVCGGWFTVEEWKRLPLAKSSTAFLQDFHHDSAILDYKPQHIAIAAINMALQVRLIICFFS